MIQTSLSFITDIIIILLRNLHKKFVSRAEYLINIPNVIDVNPLHESQGLHLYKAVPGFHELTNCDYNFMLLIHIKYLRNQKIIFSKKYSCKYYFTLLQILYFDNSILDCILMAMLSLYQ